MHQHEHDFAFLRARGTKKARRRFGIEDEALDAVHHVAVRSLCQSGLDRFGAPVGGFIGDRRNHDR